jgi:hypothetical protein
MEEGALRNAPSCFFDSLEFRLGGGRDSVASEAHVGGAAGMVLNRACDNGIHPNVDLGAVVGSIPGRCHRELKIQGGAMALQTLPDQYSDNISHMRTEYGGIAGKELSGGLRR